MMKTNYAGTNLKKSIQFGNIGCDIQNEAPQRHGIEEEERPQLPLVHHSSWDVSTDDTVHGKNYQSWIQVPSDGVIIALMAARWDSLKIKVDAWTKPLVCKYKYKIYELSVQGKSWQLPWKDWRAKRI